MNISASYNLLPDFTRSYPKDPSLESYPLSRPEKTHHFPVETDSRPSSDKARTYKYYVLSDATDTVYTRKRNTEKLFAQDKGTLVNLYV